jgi:hypothetical protein
VAFTNGPVVKLFPEISAATGDDVTWSGGVR